MMKKINCTVLLLGLLGSGMAFSAPELLTPNKPVTLTVPYVEGFLNEAGLQVCSIEELNPAASPWKGTVASMWVEIAQDCSKRNLNNPDIARIQQFDNTPDRDRVVSHYRTNAPRGINLRAGIWPVGDFSAVALIGPNVGKNRQALQKVYEKRLAESKNKK